MTAYDIFAYLYDRLNDDILSNPEKVAAFARELYDCKFHEEKNMAEILTKKLGTTICTGMSWQVAEIFSQLFSEKAEPEISKIDSEIKKKNYEIQQLKQSTNEADKRRKDRVNSEVRNLRKKLENHRKAKETKPVWSGKIKAGTVALGAFIADKPDSRRADAENMPPICFRMEVTAPILTPIVLKGDRAFVAHGNPFSTEKVTGRPMIRPSSLKGQFRQALITVCHENEQGQIELLCGHANEDDDTGQKGRLEFLPCYIDKEIRHDVIAPHNEKIRRIDPGPVTIEVVDPPLVLSLWIQYWPLDLLSIWASQRRVNEEDLIFDLIYTVAGIHYWLSRIGIGAKTSSGYGKIDYDSAKVSLFAAKASPWKSLLEKQPCPVKELIATKYQKHLVNRFSLKWAEFQQSVEKTGL